MFEIKKPLKLMIWIAGIVLSISLVACTPEVPVIESPEPEPEIETVVPAATETRETPPTPAVDPTVLLVSGVEADSFTWSQTHLLLETLAENSIMRLVVLEEPAPEMITPEVQVVVGVGSNLDLNGFALRAPGVSFVAIGDPDAAVTENLSLIGDPLVEMRQQAFMAGYVSAVISQDNKIAALIPEDSAARDLLAESYVVGARFYCGICQPIYPPYNAFPQWEALPSGITDEGFRPVVNTYFNIGVEVVYVHGELASPELLDYLEELGMKVVSDRSPDIQRSNWVGTITTDPAPALEALWTDLLAGVPGTHLPAAIVLNDTESGLISDGRMRLFDVMIADLQAGMVSVEIIP